MIVKKYIANTVEEAQRTIREELGPKATVLTLRYVKQKGWRALFAADNVEVTAAIEEADLEAHTGKAMERAQVTKAGREDLADNLAALKRSVQELEAAPEQSSLEQASPSEGSKATYGDPRFKRSTKASSIQEEAVEPAPRSQPLTPQEEERAIRKLAALRGQAAPSKRRAEASSEPSVMFDDFAKVGKGLLSKFGQDEQQDTPSTTSTPSSAIPSSHSRAPRASSDTTPLSQSATDLDSLRRMIREELHGIHGASSASAPTSTVQLSSRVSKDTKFLVAKGIDASIAEAVAKEADTAGTSSTDHVNALKAALSGRVKTAGPLQLKRGLPTVVAIVGATGVGKTTTLTKLASYYALEMGKRVAVISLDIIKVGAREQIRALTDRIGCPLTVVTDALELRAAVATHTDYDLILIDTAGQNQYHATEVRALGRTLESVRGLTTLLAVSATTKDIDVYGTINQFGCMEIDSLIVTKLDETIAHGILVNVSAKTGKTLRYLTDGQRLDDDLTVADSDTIARSILVDHNERNLDEIRRMAGV